MATNNDDQIQYELPALPSIPEYPRSRLTPVSKIKVKGQASMACTNTAKKHSNMHGTFINTHTKDPEIELSCLPPDFVLSFIKDISNSMESCILNKIIKSRFVIWSI